MLGRQDRHAEGAGGFRERGDARDHVEVGVDRRREARLHVDHDQHAVVAVDRAGGHGAPVQRRFATAAKASSAIASVRSTSASVCAIEM